MDTEKIIEKVISQIEGQNWIDRPIAPEEKHLIAMAVQATVAELGAPAGVDPALPASKAGASPLGQGAIDKALDVIQRYGGIDGDHHKTWVIDQVVRALTGDGYEQWVIEQRDGEDGPETYAWDVGIPP